MNLTYTILPINSNILKDKNYPELHEILCKSKDKEELFFAIHAMVKITGQWKQEAFATLALLMAENIELKSILEREFLFTVMVKVLADSNDPAALHAFIRVTHELEEGDYRLSVLQDAIELLIYRNYQKSPAWPGDLVAYLFNNKEYNHIHETITSVTETLIKAGVSRVEVYTTLLVHIDEEVRRFAAEKLAQIENWQPADDFQRAAYLAAGEKYPELVAMGNAASEFIEFAASNYATSAGISQREDNVTALKKLMLNTVPHLPAGDIATVYLEWIGEMNSIWTGGATESIYRAVEALPRPLDPAFVDKLEELARKTGGKESSQLYRITRMLSWLLESESESVRAADVLFSLVNDESIHENNRQEAVIYLSSAIDSRALEPLLGIIESTREYTVYDTTALDLKLASRWSAIEALGKLGDPRAYEPLVKMLEEKTIYSRVLSALGDLGDSRAYELLVKALENGDDGDDGLVRIRAIEALGKLGDSRAYEPLVKILEDGNDGDDYLARIRAIESLGKLGDSRAYEPLVKILEDGNEERLRRLEAVIALVKLDDSRVYESLVKLLDDEDGSIRNHAISGLGNIGDSRARKLLVKMLDDEESYNREEAAEALDKLAK